MLKYEKKKEKRVKIYEEEVFTYEKNEEVLKYEKKNVKMC